MGVAAIKVLFVVAALIWRAKSATYQSLYQKSFVRTSGLTFLPPDEEHSQIRYIKTLKLFYLLRYFLKDKVAYLVLPGTKSNRNQRF